MPHNIYLLLPTIKGEDYIDYGCNDGQVIIADTEEEARKFCAISDEGDIWTNPELTSCELIGITYNKSKGQLLVSNVGA